MKTQTEKKYLHIITLILFGIVIFGCNTSKDVHITSPNGNIALMIYTSFGKSDDGIVKYSIQRGEDKPISRSTFFLDADIFKKGNSFSVKSIEKQQVNNQWTDNFGERKIVPEIYKQVRLLLESDKAKLNLIFRVYNEGIAFSYEIPAQNNLDSLLINDELISYKFTQNHLAWTTNNQEGWKFQNIYSRVKLSEIEYRCDRPLVVECDNNLFIALGEAKLVDYARMRFDPVKSDTLAIRSRLDSEVSLALPFQSPWRYMMIADNPGQLLEQNYLVKNLNDPSAIEDESWIKPGKAIREVTLTTTGARATIDYCHENNFQYVLFDAGWYGEERRYESDATTVTLDPKRSKGPFNIHEIIDYANSKGIKVIVYVNYRHLETQLDEILPLYKAWGISGLKFGFVRVENQDAMVWLHKAIMKAADNRMIVDVHDFYRPTGFSRTYPNLLTQEGIRGDENSTTNTFTLNTMFTRMLAGAADNTICYYNNRVETMGSHASQLAKAVCIFSPLQFIYWYDKVPNAPVKSDGLWGDTKHIGNEPELEFFNNVPTTWDETKVLHAKIGELAVIARRKGNEWFIGGINGQITQNVVIDFSFLKEGSDYKAKIYTDNESIKTRTRVRVEGKQLNSKSTMELNVKVDNGFAMHLVPLE